ncbi:MAG TPA: Rrf2 family transcriptional regulator [Ignavibacteriaceae bacterium]|nr:Rrf2 family transcriptional regulator [Ignavibacteriaceae bacterium]
MKFSAQEEYGLRCLLRIGKSKNGLTIPEISQLEGLSTANVGKLLRILRLGGFIESARGQNGGYKLVKLPNEIIIGEVLTVLGGKFYENDFCNDHSGAAPICANSIDCSVRSLLKTMQNMFDQVLSKITLRDMLGNEEEVKLLTINLADIDSN